MYTERRIRIQEVLSSTKKEKNMVGRKIFWGKKTHKFQEIYFENESRGIKNRMK